jgi:hypothetical protein
MSFTAPFQKSSLATFNISRTSVVTTRKNRSPGVPRDRSAAEWRHLRFLFRALTPKPAGSAMGTPGLAFETWDPPSKGQSKALWTSTLLLRDHFHPCPTANVRSTQPHHPQTTQPHSQNSNRWKPGKVQPSQSPPAVQSPPGESTTRSTSSHPAPTGQVSAYR